MGPRTHISGSNAPDAPERLVSPCCHKPMSEDEVTCRECGEPCDPVNEPEDDGA